MKEPSSISEILLRLFKVVFIALYLFGLLFAYTVSIPYGVVTTSNVTGTVINCDNGKTFDPLSKPIYPKGDKSKDYAERYFGSADHLRQIQLSSECAYGDSALIGESVALPQNYSEEAIYETEFNLERRGGSFLIIVTLYLLGIDIVRRTFRYIVYGTSFLKSGLL